MNDFDTLLAAADPVDESALRSSELAGALDALGGRITAAERRPRRRYRRGAVALAFAAVVFLTAAIAFGRMLTTHTGFFPSKPGTENDTTELLRTDAPDFPPLVAKLVRDIPFPPGDSALSRVGTYVREKQPGPDGIPETVQAAGIRGTFSLWAVCAWRGYWLREHEAGHRAHEALAAAGLAEVASSEAEKKTDSFWPIYLGVARSEAAGSAAAPRDFQAFYRVNCAK
jgi:hypothetical protein